MNDYTLGNKPELFDDQIDLATAISPVSSTIYATVFIASVNGTVVTLDVGANSVDPDDGKFAGTTNYDLVTELTATMVRQTVAVAADTTINGTLGNLVSVTQSATANLTLLPADAALPYIFEIKRESSAGTWGLTISNAIYPSGIVPTYSASPTEDEISALYLPAPIGKWLTTAAIGFTYQGTAAFKESVGGHTRYINDELHKKKINKFKYLGRLSLNQQFPMQMTVPDTFALEAGQECVVSPTGDLYATEIKYSKPTNTYISEVFMSDTSEATVLRMQTITQTSGDIVVDYLLGNIVYMVQNQNITSFTIINAPLNTIITWVRQKDATANVYTVAMSDTAYFGETLDSPVYTGTANAIDLITFTTSDGGLKWATSIINDFR